MKATKPRKQYSRAFKLEAVGLAVRGEKPATVIARDLGISVNLLYNWKRDYLDDKEHSFPGTGHLQNPEDERVRKLERELRDIREERDILKKVVSIFSKDPR
jgi:transposase